MAAACTELAEFFGVPALPRRHSPPAAQRNDLSFTRSFDAHSPVNPSHYSLPLSNAPSPLRNYEKFLGMQTPDLKLVKPVMPVQRRTRMNRSVSKKRAGHSKAHPYQVYRHRAIWNMFKQ